MKIKSNWYDILVEIAGLGCMIGTAVFLALRWKYIPNEIPSHFNAAGEIDRWSMKYEIVVYEIISAILYLVLSLIEKFPGIWNTGVTVTEENKHRVYRVLKDLLGSTKALITVIFSVIIIHCILVRPLPSWLLPVFLIIFFGSLVFHIIQLFRVK